MGSIRTDKKPSSDVAHPIPSFEYTKDMSVSITVRSPLHTSPEHFLLQGASNREMDLLCTVNSGNTAPSVYLKIPFAAIALAPFSGPYTSVIYSAALVCLHH